MAHPLNEHRDHKVQHRRVADIAAACGGHMAVGGGTHGDVAEDKALIHKMVKKKALRATGGAVKARADRPARAWGGRSPKRKGIGKAGKHTVNIMVGAHPAAMGAAMPMRPPVVPGVAAAPPPVAPPPMARPAVQPPPGIAGGVPGANPMPPGVPPPGIRYHGGRAYKKGGKVEAVNPKPKFTGKAHDGGKGHLETANTAGIGRGRTLVQHARGKQDGRNIGRGPVITKATGGPIIAPEGAHSGMGPNFTGGSRGGMARMEKAHRVAKSGFGRETIAARNPTENPKA